MIEWDGKDRRKASDFWKLFARLLAIGGWVCFVLALFISYYAAPEQNYGYLRYKHIETREWWLTPLTGYLYMILWFSALSSYLSITIDKFRKRRATDNKHYNVILLLVISIAWSAYIIFHIIR